MHVNGHHLRDEVASHLVSQAEILVDTIEGSLAHEEFHHQQPLDLPPKHVLRYDLAFFERLLEAARGLLEKMRGTEEWRPGSTAEELLLVDIFSGLRASLHDEAKLDDPWPGGGDEPETDPLTREELEEVHARIVEDFDVLWLWELRLDGIEQAPTTVAEELQPVHLVFDQWFEPFAERVGDGDDERA